MIKSISFKKDTILYSASVFVERGLGIITLPILTIGLSAEFFGVWTQIQSIYGFLSALFLLGFYQSAPIFIVGLQDKKLKIFLTNIIIFIFIYSISISFIIFIIRDYASILLFANINFQYLIIYILIYSVTECLYELIVLSFLRSLNRVLEASIIQITKSLIRLIIIAIFISNNNQVIIFLNGISIINLVLIIFSLVKFRILNFYTLLNINKCNFNQGLKIFKTSVFIAITGMFAWITIAANRFIIVQLHGVEAITVYSANYSALSLSTFLPMILTYSILHHLKIRIESNDFIGAKKLLENVIKLYFFITIPIMVLVWIMYFKIIEYLSPNYPCGNVLRISLIIYFILFGLEQVLVFSSFINKKNYALYSRLLSLFFTLTLAYILIYKMGPDYAVIPLCFGSLISIFVCIKSINLVINRLSFFDYVIKIFFLGFFILIIGRIFQNLINNSSLLENFIFCFIIFSLYLLFESIFESSFTRKIYRNIISIRFNENLR